MSTVARSSPQILASIEPRPSIEQQSIIANEDFEEGEIRVENTSPESLHQNAFQFDTTTFPTSGNSEVQWQALRSEIDWNSSAIDNITRWRANEFDTQVKDKLEIYGTNLWTMVRSELHRELVQELEKSAQITSSNEKGLQDSFQRRCDLLQQNTDILHANSLDSMAAIEWQKESADDKIAVATNEFASKMQIIEEKMKLDNIKHAQELAELKAMVGDLETKHEEVVEASKRVNFAVNVVLSRAEDFPITQSTNPVEGLTSVCNL
jgi:hypothetical protein